jgi:hypothetical protein
MEKNDILVSGIVRVPTEQIIKANLDLGDLVKLSSNVANPI